MGIDGIGKKGGANGIAPTHDAAKPVGEGARFDPSRAVGTQQTSGVAPLDRLRSGEIDVPKYLDLKVDEATAHLQGLPSADLATIREILREQLATDPALAALVQQATRGA